MKFRKPPSIGGKKVPQNSAGKLKREQTGISETDEEIIKRRGLKAPFKVMTAGFRLTRKSGQIIQILMHRAMNTITVFAHKLVISGTDRTNSGSN